MALKIKLTRDLRRNLLRGQPWVYKNSIEVPKNITQAESCKVTDPKGEFVCWAYYDPQSPLALRCFGPNAPTDKLFKERISKARQLRENINTNETNAYRLINGEGDLLPGVIVDIYNNIAIIQYDGLGPKQFWQKNFPADFLLETLNLDAVFLKPRKNDNYKFTKLAGKDTPAQVTILENKHKFLVDTENGQKTGFFLDQRDNRSYLGNFSKAKTTLNLFSYNGGFSIYAGKAQSTQVTSVDLSKGAIEDLEKNWLANNLNPGLHKGLAIDVFDYLENEKSKWDQVIVDPPSMAHSEKQKDSAHSKYIDCFAKAAKRVNAGGSLYLSSCSSHISFEDFFEITTQALSKARRKGQIVRVSGQGPDHPFLHVCPEMRYLKFFHITLD